MKTIARFFTAMMITSLFIGQIYAQTTPATDSKETQKASTTPVTAGKFVDKNNNGICDHHETGVKDGKCAGKSANCCSQGQKEGCGKDQGCCKGGEKANCTGKNHENCQGPGKGNCNKGQGNDSGCKKQTECKKTCSEPKK
jgi:hypothetical protein